MSDNRILCLASEKGKNIVNKCLEEGYHINTLKLEQLLVLVHGIMLAKYDKAFFNQNVVVAPQGFIIKEVEREFIMYAVEFKEKLPENITLLELEEKIVNYVIKHFGNYDICGLKETPVLKTLKGLCYNWYSLSMVPNQTIKKVFTDFGYCDLRTVKDNNKSYQKKLK